VHARESNGSTDRSREPDDAEAEGFVHELLRTRANSIDGGTSEIQHNSVGERVLDLPREPDAFKGRSWQEVPRS